MLTSLSWMTISNSSLPTAADGSPTTVFTIGHSTRPADELVELLQRHGVEVLVDTRGVPLSRHNPQFNAATLAPFLAERGLEYLHQPLLSGRRKPRPDSPNSAWEHPSFRGYADYMLTPDFERGIQALEQLARLRACAVMCAELAWWRCHRRLIADRLAVDGFTVLHIFGPRQQPYPHRTSPGLMVTNGRISYPTVQPSLFPNSP